MVPPPLSVSVRTPPETVAAAPAKSRIVLSPKNILFAEKNKRDVTHHKAPVKMRYVHQRKHVTVLDCIEDGHPAMTR